MDFKSLCRICLNKNDHGSNIFTGKSSDEILIYEVINFVYDLEISIDDGLPEYVCQECFIVIKNFENYKKNAHRSKKELMLLREKNNVFIKVEDEESENSMDAHVSEDGQFQEPQIEVHEKENFENNSLEEEYEEMKDETLCNDVQSLCECKMDIYDDAGSLSCQKNVNSGNINYVEYHESEIIPCGSKKEPEDVEDWLQEETSFGVNDAMRKTKEGEKRAGYAKEEDALEKGKNRAFVKRENAEDIVSEEGHVSCHYCGEERENLGKLKEHIFNKHLSKEERGNDDKFKKRRYKCPLCEKAFLCNSDVENHMRVHTGEKPFKCSHCDYKTGNKSHLKKHMYRHTGGNPYKCTLCDYSSAEKSHLKNHMYKHGGEKPFKCELCPYSTAMKYNLTTHMFTHTGEKRFKCPLCDYRTAVESQLKPHIYTHTGEKPFKCNICEYRAVTRSQLKCHILTHTGEKPFKCNLCDYSSSIKKGLKNHMFQHTSEKPFKCTICKYGTGREFLLKRHMLTHSSEKKFKCDLCDYQSAFRDSLILHMRKHTGEKPFQCNLCEFRTTCRANLNSHIRTHSTIKLFKCNLCDYSVTKCAYFKRHMLKHK